MQRRLLRLVFQRRRARFIGLATRNFSVRAYDPAFVRIGGVHSGCSVARGPVPEHYAPREVGDTLARHLRWMLQKDRVLGQDFLLLGPPGPGRRRAALTYAQLARRAVEFVAITPDTTEADLKQRREIRGDSIVYVDQPPVRAALSGALLVIEGLERAERNVLPLLNNLLENREMALEDGRFLCSPQRWRALLAEGASEADLASRGLSPVHADFRVCAITLPAPPYPGRALDPPLRSRFSARYIPLDEPAAGEHGDGGVAAARLIAAAMALRDLGAEAAGAESAHGASRAALPQVDQPALAAALFQLRSLPGLAACALPGLLHRAVPYWFLPEYAARAPGAGIRQTASTPSRPLLGELCAILDTLAAPVGAAGECSVAAAAAAPDAFILRRVVSTSPGGRLGEVEMTPASLLRGHSGGSMNGHAPWAPIPIALGEHAETAWSWENGSAVGPTHPGAGFSSTLPLESTLAGMVVSHAAGRDMLLLGPPGKRSTALHRSSLA